MAPVRILIAGEHSIFRHGLRRLLEAEPDFRMVAETSDPAATPALLQGVECDVLLLGFATCGQPALLTTLRELAARPSPPRVVILADRVDVPELADALHDGARGVVLKDSSPETLFDCIRSVAAGALWLGDQRITAVATGLRKLDVSRRRSKAFGLTRREIQIVRDVVAGCTNREIAERAHITENTVKSHLTRIFDKSGASSRVELALFAEHHRLLDGL